MSIGLESIDTSNIDAILIQVLQEIGDHKDGQDAQINLPQDLLILGGVNFNIAHAFVELIVVVKTFRCNRRNNGNLDGLELIGLLSSI